MAEPTAVRKDHLFDEVYGQGLGYYYFNAHNQVRLHQSAFYEKVALLDGGTVALTITAVIGKVQGQIRHPFALKSGLVCLALAMLILFARNFFWTRYEWQVMEMKFTNSTVTAALTDIARYEYPQRLCGVFGLLLTTVGLLILIFVATTLF